MRRRSSPVPCAVCNDLTPSHKLSRVVIDGHTIPLCREHAAAVATRMPRSFEELRDLFRETGSEHPDARRSTIDRRASDDRRVFPPRPEGRRMEGGRRSSDVPA